MPAGRPTLYKPEFCEQAVELGKLGKSPVQIACAFNVARPTLIVWGQEHPEFLTALELAKAHEQDWWENVGQTNMLGGQINAAIWKKSMEARFREDYTERKEVSGNLSAVILTNADADL